MLERLRRDAEHGGVGAARELLRHLRWQADREVQKPASNAFDALDEFDALRDSRLHRLRAMRGEQIGEDGDDEDN